MKMMVDESLCKDFHLLLFLSGRRQTIRRIPSRALLGMGKHFLVKVFTNEINPGQKRFHYNLVGFQATVETARGLKT